MAVEHHEKEWPDKVLFASLLMVMGGLLGMLFAAMQLLDLVDPPDALVFLESVAWWWVMALSAPAFLFGLLGVKYQAWIWVAAAIVCAFFSLGFFLLESLLAILASITLIRARVEGEEMTMDHQTVSAAEWPDKAIIASLFLAAVGFLAISEGIMAFSGSIEPYYADWLADTGWLIGLILLAAGGFVLFASRMAYKQHRRWAAWAGAIVGIVLGSYVFVGSLLGLVTLLFLWLADKEGEFDGGDQVV